jgi:arylsulfatase A-like enzyme
MNITKQKLLEFSSLPAVFCAGLFCAASALSYGADESRRPNIVYLLVDDLGQGDLGCYGNTLFETPNIDRLRSGGMKLTNAYSACSVCSPSRAAILTGRYPARLHLTDWIPGHKKPFAKLSVPDWQMFMDSNQTTLAEALKENGYRTFFIGKWHLMPENKPARMPEHTPERHGFDVNIAGREWGQPKGPGKYFYPWGDLPGITGGEPGDFLDDRLTDEALSFLDHPGDKPFLLYMAYYLVHGPFMCKPEYEQKYLSKANADPESWTRLYGSNTAIAVKYAGMVQTMDDSVGRLMQKLRERGLDKNTIIIFTSDNGGLFPGSAAGLRGKKGTAYEGGTRVPAIVRWPGKVAPGSLCDDPVIGMDYFPTILESVGLKAMPEQHCDGKSILPLLTQTAGLPPRDLYWHYPHYHQNTAPYSAVRSGDWKLVEFLENGKLELYDLKKDPAESHNCASESPDKTAMLKSKLDAWRRDVGAQMPGPNPKYDPSHHDAPKKPGEAGNLGQPKQPDEAPSIDRTE